MAVLVGVGGSQGTSEIYFLPKPKFSQVRFSVFSVKIIWFLVFGPKLLKMTENAENRYQNRYHSYTRGNKRRQLRRRRRRRQETERGGPQEAAGVWVAALSRKRWITGLTSKLLRSFLPLPYSSPLLVLRRHCDVIHVQCASERINRRTILCS